MTHVCSNDSRSPAAAVPAGIEIVPLGSIRRHALEGIARGLRSVFGCSVSVAPAQETPETACQSSRGQYNTSMILNATRPVVWKKGWKRLAVLDVDIFSGNLNFVFGQADPSGSTALVSLCRLANQFYSLAADDALLVERAVKEAVHEIGHMLALAHCKSPECVMYFSNSLSDTDKKRASFCPACKGRISSGGAS